MESEGIRLIAAERQRQVESEGWSTDHDVRAHCPGDLSDAAACYAAFRDGERSDLYRAVQHPFDCVLGVDYGAVWPGHWHPSWDKRGKHNRLRRLVIAGALIAAEIDRGCRAHGPQQANGASQ